MQICFPIAEDRGLESELYGHFPSAPLFLIVDSATDTAAPLANCDPESPYAGCNPFRALAGRTIDAIVVDAIGDDALSTMNLCGFRVYQARSRSLPDSLARIAKNGLDELMMQESAGAGRCVSNESGCNCSSHHHTTEGEQP